MIWSVTVHSDGYSLILLNRSAQQSPRLGPLDERELQAPREGPHMVGSRESGPSRTLTTRYCGNYLEAKCDHILKATGAAEDMPGPPQM
jgi:hypothetical protein